MEKHYEPGFKWAAVKRVEAEKMGVEVEGGGSGSGASLAWVYWDPQTPAGGKQVPCGDHCCSTRVPSF